MLDVIERDNHSEYQRANAMLKQFSRKHPTNFTTLVLAKALIAAERTDIAEMINPTH